jgi:hypothetical protein
MQFFSNFFNFGANSIKKLEKQAKDVLDLPNDLKAFRLEKEIVIVGSNKIIQRLKDTLPLNPIRATAELIKRLKLASNNKIQNKKSDVLTCGFRDNEARWVWYRNSEPIMTISYDEAYKQGSLEDKIYFYSARYGTKIAERLKQDVVEKVAQELNALVLENPFVKVKCASCSNEENYTIDDLVDNNKQPKYDSNFVVCQNCNELVKLQ